MLLTGNFLLENTLMSRIHKEAFCLVIKEFLLGYKLHKIPRRCCTITSNDPISNVKKIAQLIKHHAAIRNHTMLQRTLTLSEATDVKETENEELKPY